jgi:hypothetical protein
MREPMSDNWQLISQGVFLLYKAKDNSHICTAYVERPKYPMIVSRVCYIRDLNLITGPLSKYKWCAQFADENRDGWRLYLRFGGHFCQDILDRNESLDQYCPDWRGQLEQICLDFRKENLYKITMDPKYFFIDEDGILKTFAFFNSFTYREQPVMIEATMPTFSTSEAQLVRSRTQSGGFDFKYLEKYVYNNSAWPESILEQIYTKMYAHNGQDTQI